MSETLPPIYFVRHGETEWNRLGLIQGWRDISLNETGHAQAQNVARAFFAHPEVSKDCRFAVSPLGRARQRGDSAGLPRELRSGLTERHCRPKTFSCHTILSAISFA